MINYNTLSRIFILQNAPSAISEKIKLINTQKANQPHRVLRANDLTILICCLKEIKKTQQPKGTVPLNVIKIILTFRKMA